MAMTFTDTSEASAPTTSEAVRVRTATPDDWAAAIASDPLALPEQSPRWLAAIADCDGHRDISRAYVRSDGSTVVVPLVNTRRGTIWSPPPAWGVGGPVGADIDASVVQSIVDDLRGLKASRVAVRVDPRHETVWQQVAHDAITVPRRSHVVELAASPDEHLMSLSKSARRQIQLSGRRGAEVVIDREGRLLEQHYELFMQSVERWAQKQHEPARLARLRAQRRDPISKLSAMQAALGDRFLIVMALVEGVPASSAIVLLGPTSRYVRGAMDIDLAGLSRASFAVQWAAIQQIFEAGGRRYHMGESGGSEGISAFKEKFGAHPIDHHEYRFERIPLTAGTDLAKGAVKRLIGFRD